MDSPAEARHPLRHIGLEAHALLLAVVGDVDAGRGLLVDHVLHGAIHLARELSFVDGLAVLAPDQKIGQSLIARQAADVSSQNTFSAQDHVTS